MHEDHSSPDHQNRVFRHSFDDPALFAEKFDHPDRDLWQKPDELLAVLDLADDMVIAEIGPGTGYFTTRMAKLIENGKLIAVESSPQMREFLQRRLKQLQIDHVEVLVPPDARFPELEMKVDLVFCVDVYHHLPDRVSYFTHVKKSLQPKGRLVNLDRSIMAPIGPPVEHRIPPESVLIEME